MKGRYSFAGELVVLGIVSLGAGVSLTATYWLLQGLPWSNLRAFETLRFLLQHSKPFAYFFTLPLFFGLGLLLLVRQIYHDYRVVLFILLVACFSPPIVFGLANQQRLIASAIGFWFLASFLRFLKSPSRQSSWLLLGMLIAACILIPLFRQSQVLPYLVQPLPALDFLNGLKISDPMKLLTVGVPGIGFNHSFGNPVMVYSYLGMLTLPLAFVGLIFNRSVWRGRLFILTGISAVLLGLLDFHPGTMELWVTLVLSAGLGLQTVLESGTIQRWALALCFLFTSLGSLGYFLISYGISGLVNPIFGFAVAMTFFYGIALAWLAMEHEPKHLGALLFLLLFLTFIDVSTVAFWQWKSLIRIAYHAV